MRAHAYAAIVDETMTDLLERTPAIATNRSLPVKLVQEPADT